MCVCVSFELSGLIACYKNWQIRCTANCLAVKINASFSVKQEEKEKIDDLWDIQSFWTFTVSSHLDKDQCNWEKCVFVCVCVCICVWSAEGKGEGVQPSVHVPPAVCCREGFQCQHAGHSALPGISDSSLGLNTTKILFLNVAKIPNMASFYWLVCCVLPVICEGLHDLHHQAVAGFRLHAWLGFPLCSK